MASWKIKVDVLRRKEGDTSLFPYLEVHEHDLEFEEDSVIKIFNVATELAQKQFRGSPGYKFIGIERTDKNTGKDYFRYIEDHRDPMANHELEVILTEEQKIAMKDVHGQIQENIRQQNNYKYAGEAKNHFYNVALLHRLEKNIFYLVDNMGNVLGHSEFEAVKAFYENITPLEITVLNINGSATVEDYDSLRKYLKT